MLNVNTESSREECYYCNILPNRCRYLPEGLGKETASCQCCNSISSTTLVMTLDRNQIKLKYGMAKNCL